MSTPEELLRVAYYHLVQAYNDETIQAFLYGKERDHLDATIALFVRVTNRLEETAELIDPITTLEGLEKDIGFCNDMDTLPDLDELADWHKAVKLLVGYFLDHPLAPEEPHG